MKTETAISEDEQRKCQALFFNLDPSATWEQIDEAALESKKSPIFFYDYEDWRETIVRLYGPILPM